MAEAESLQIAFLAEGKLYVKRGAMAPQLLESPFAQGVLDRAAQGVQRHGWRERTNDTPFSGRLLWGRSLQPRETRQVRITALTRAPRGDPADLLYAMDTGAVGGLFTYEIQSGSENRLFHKQEFSANDLACHGAKHLMALSTRMEDGTGSIAIMQPGNRKLHAVTEGDSLDEAPSWVPTADNPDREVLVYHSAGLARDSRGMACGVGPRAIHRLDVDRGQFSTLLEDAQWDYLVPRVRLEDGKERLYFIRRPFKLQEGISFWRVPLDILLFPFRLLCAIFAFLNVFSMFFSGKPLTTAGGPKQPEVDTRFMMLHGRWIDTQKALRAARKGQVTALVPANWELMSMDENGKLTSLGTSVLSFDLGPGGTVVYTNGSEIFRMAPGEKPERVCQQKMVQQVMVLA